MKYINSILTKTQQSVKNHYTKPDRWLTVSSIIVSCVMLLAATTYSVLQSSHGLSSYSDSFSSTYIASDWTPGDTINLSDQHTNLIKLPILWLQGTLPYNYASYLALNIALVVVTVFGWSALVYWFFRSKRAFVISNVMLTGLVLASTSLVYSLTITTTRNIEYPLALLYLLLLRGTIRSKNRRSWIIAAVVLALLVADDYLFIYSLVPGVILLLLWLWWRKNIDKTLLYRLGGNLAIGALAGIGLLKFLQMIHVFDYFEYPIGSFVTFTQFPTQIWNSLGYILQQFGGYILGSPIKITYSGMALCCLFAVVAAFSFTGIIRKIAHDKTKLSPAKFFDSFLPLALIGYCVMLFLFYTLANLPSNDSRYMSFIPFAAVLLIIYWSKSWRRNGAIILISSLVLFGGLINSYHNYYSYQSSNKVTDDRVGAFRKIDSLLGEYKVPLALSSYNFGPMTRFYSTSGANIYHISPCNVAKPGLSDSSWYDQRHNIRRSALIVDRYDVAGGLSIGRNGEACSPNRLKQIYGEPFKRLSVAAPNGNRTYILIYNYDIRSRLFVPDHPFSP